VKSLDTLKAEVFDVGGTNSPDLDIAFASLRLALRAYFSTYGAISGRLHVMADPTASEEDVDFQHGWKYSEASAETVVHFQHFAELVCKNFLRKDHSLLVEPSTKPEILHKLLHGEALSAEEQQAQTSIEFSVTLERLKRLVAAGLLKDAASLHWLGDHIKMLSELNYLRNRIWHRGKYVLRYAALDVFVGGYVLPFVQRVVLMPGYVGEEFRWAPSTPSCGLDLIGEIIQEASTVTPNLRKLAFLKATGAAAFDTPLRGRKPRKNVTFASFAEMFDVEVRKHAKAKASAIAELEHCSVATCHVCGVESLVVFTEFDHNYDEFGEHGESWEYSHQVRCECCGFMATPEVGNASELGLVGIPDMWFTKKF